MSETQNTTRNNTGQGASSSGASRSVPKKLWGYFNAFLDYLDEEVPGKKRAPETPSSKKNTLWTKFNSFLDSLETDTADREPQASAGDNAGNRSDPLKKTGNVCWEIVFHSAIIVFLFALAVFATIKALDFVNARHVSFYPSREVMQYLTAEHESLEAVADALPHGNDRSDSISPDKFGEQCTGILKPLKIYSDEYGIYLVTGKNAYVGENGIFIARDAKKMPDDLSWGLIEGRIFTYAFFE